MAMDYTDRKRAAAAFAKRWEGRGYEKGETASFWNDFLQEVAGIEHVSDVCRFEHRVREGGFIDAWLPDQGVLIEQKSSGVDLDKPEVRQGREVTPYQQALAYAQQMPLNQQPRWIVVCNFETFRIHDRDKADPERDYMEVPLARLADDIALFSFFSGQSARSVREKQASITAGELIGKLHAALSAQYADPESDESQHALNVLCVRLVFCLYAEDSGLFSKDLFLSYLRQFEARHMRRALIDLFEVLDTPVSERDPYLDDDLKRFPYVNGGLFRGQVEIPNFTDDIKTLLLLDVSLKTDWSTISPTIFGGVFESTLNPATRRSGGMHYTSPENIHKVIDPLFLDDLRAEYRAIKDDETLGDKRRRNRLLAFQDRLSSLTFFDPACGSGNFLTETYLCLRRLENQVLADLMNIRGKDRSAKQFTENQMALGFEDADAGDALGVKVNIGQFYGIEINDFAVRVAKTALWIAELQANVESEYVIQQDIEDLPLRDSASIVCANALRTDWNDIMPAEKCDYIMGNPPFIGARWQTSEQKTDLLSVFNGVRNAGNIDYCGAWYMKCAQYTEGAHSKCAFVSTNSVCQGESVANLWKPLHDGGIHIDFAHNTFRWDNEATDAAHVFCVIVGFSRESGQKRLFLHDSPDSPEKEIRAENINAYLSDAPDVFVYGRRSPICNVPSLGIGSQPIDDGNYLFTTEEKDDFIEKEPASERFFHPWIGSKEFINGYTRWALWLGNAAPADLKHLPLCRERIDAVKKFREGSKRKQTLKAAETPSHFGTEIIPSTSSVVIPQVSSQRRVYVPIGFIGPDIFCSDKLRLAPGASLYHYGILQSQFHNSWMRRTSGRLKGDYQYTNSITYNCFAWPGATPETLSTPVEELVSANIRERIEKAAQAVLNARAQYEGSTLADMYDPDNEWMFPELTKAHRELDAAVEAAYGVDFQGDEEKIVAYLFELYAELTGEK